MTDPVVRDRLAALLHEMYCEPMGFVEAHVGVTDDGGCQGRADRLFAAGVLPPGADLETVEALRREWREGYRAGLAEAPGDVLAKVRAIAAKEMRLPRRPTQYRRGWAAGWESAVVTVSAALSPSPEVPAPESPQHCPGGG